MPFVSVGDTSIPYTIKRSSRARRIRIVVRPGRVEVVAPRLTRHGTIVAFVESKRRWVFEKTETLRERELVATPARFVTGAKVLFRGRWLRVRVTEGARSRRPANSLRFANAFHITVAPGLTDGEREKIAKNLVMGWLKNRALEDASGWAKSYGAKLGVSPTQLRIGNQKTLWGSCSPRGVVSLNWRLVASPKPIFEYVVVHELCHLKERNHGRKFWELVGSLLPDFRERRAWLQRHGVALG